LVIKIGNILKNYFFLGVLVIIPIAVTILVLVWIFTSVDNVLQPLIKSTWDITIPGLGIIAILIMIFLIGAIVSSARGRKLFNYSGGLLLAIPIVRPIYTTIKQILEIFSPKGRSGFQQVVLIEFTMPGTKTIGFITNESIDNKGEKLLHIFVPTAPNPTSGFLQMIKEEKVVRTNISVDDALKMIVSAGKELPSEISGDTTLKK
jgi:uncharacterized membrane protein